MFMLQELESRVLELFAAIDGAVGRFQASSGLHCPPGCVECCHSEKVEATVLEMVPMAFRLFRTDQAELLVKRLDRLDGSQRCILFRPDLVDNGGGCSQYPYRGLVCRLFGFAGSRDRYAQPRLAHCRVMKAMDSAVAPELLAEQLADMPLFSEFGLALTALQPALGTRRLPINEALRLALDKVGLVLHLEPPAAPRAGAGNSPGKPFGKPSQPRRRAA